MPEDLLMDKALKMLHLISVRKSLFRSKARWISLFAVAGSLTFLPISARLRARPCERRSTTATSAAPRRPEGSCAAGSAPCDLARQTFRKTRKPGPIRIVTRIQMMNAGPQQRNRRPYPRRQAVGDLPGTITIPAGKVIFVRLNQPLSSDHSHAGEGFTATLDQTIVVNGWGRCPPRRNGCGHRNLSQKSRTR